MSEFLHIDRNVAEASMYWRCSTKWEKTNFFYIERLLVAFIQYCCSVSGEIRSKTVNRSKMTPALNLRGSVAVTIATRHFFFLLETLKTQTNKLQIFRFLISTNVCLDAEAQAQYINIFKWTYNNISCFSIFTFTFYCFVIIIRCNIIFWLLSGTES